MSGVRKIYVMLFSQVPLNLVIQIRFWDSPQLKFDPAFAAFREDQYTWDKENGAGKNQKWSWKKALFPFNIIFLPY